ncbi:unnamed protein product [Prunus brigantina]
MSDSLVRVSRRAEWGAHEADAGSTRMPRHAETARAAYHDRVDGVSAGISTARALAAAAIRIGQRPEPIGGPACDRSTSDRGASPAPIRFPPDNFKHSLTLFSKSFSSFPRGTCLLSVSRPYLALDRIYRPIGAAFPNNPTRRRRLVVRRGSGHNGALTLSGATFRWTWARSAGGDASPDYNSDAMGARFSSWAIPGSLAVTRGILVTEPEPGNFFEPSMRDDRTRRAAEVSQPPIVVACVAEDLAFMPTARRAHGEAIIRPPAIPKE